MSPELKERVMKFEMLELDGQPKFMHMGTAYLVRDLFTALMVAEREIAALERDLEARAALMVRT